MTGTAILEHSVDIDATPSTVYDMWTTAAGLSAWWGTAVSVDARPGGAIEVDVDGGHVMVGEFVELDAPRLIVFTFGWRDSDPRPGSTTVTVRIEPVGPASRLTLRHAGLALEHIESHARGWIHFVGGRLRTTTRRINDGKRWV